MSQDGLELKESSPPTDQRDETANLDSISSSKKLICQENDKTVKETVLQEVKTNEKKNESELSMATLEVGKGSVERGDSGVVIDKMPEESTEGIAKSMTRPIVDNEGRVQLKLSKHYAGELIQIECNGLGKKITAECETTEGGQIVVHIRKKGKLKKKQGAKNASDAKQKDNQENQKEMADNGKAEEGAFKGLFNKLKNSGDNRSASATPENKRKRAKSHTQEEGTKTPLTPEIKLAAIKTENKETGKETDIPAEQDSGFKEGTENDNSTEAEPRKGKTGLLTNKLRNFSLPGPRDDYKQMDTVEPMDKRELRKRMVVAVVIIIVLIVIPMTMIVIGARYMQECKKQRMIPIHLIVSGTFAILVIVFTILYFGILRYKFRSSNSINKDDDASNASSSEGNHAGSKNKSKEWNNAYVISYLLMLIGSIVLVVCLLSGAVLVFRIHGQVELNSSKNSNSCNFLVYMFSFGIHITTFILFALLIVISITWCVAKSHIAKNSTDQNGRRQQV